MKTLILIDFINEIVHPDGKLSGKGYADFVKQHKTLENVLKLTEKAKAANTKVIWVNIQFESDYSNCPPNSPLFGAAEKFGALKSNTWATKIHQDLTVDEGDLILPKERVSIFSNSTLLEHINDSNEILIAGVATDLAVSASVFDAHDLDYNITVVSDACGAANNEDHTSALKQLAKIAKISRVEEIQF